MTSPFPVSSVRRKAAFLLILAGALSARGQTGAAADKAPAADPKPLRECHVWRLDYGDDELGVVSGKACIDWEGRSVLVQLVSPVDGTRSLLTADRFSPADAQGQMEFVLTGLSPNLQKVVAPATAGLPNLHGGQGVQINAKSGDSHFAAATRFGDSADSTVTVSLSAAADNTLNGSWHYRADPVTERNLDGVGRVGAFAMPSGDQAVFLGMQTGWEEWTPLPPRIFYVEVLDDQTGQHFGPICPYPASTNAARTLMIVGQNLPILEGTLRQGGVPIPSPGGGAQRCLEPIKTDRTDFSYEDATLYQDPAMGLVQAKPNDQVERAWQRITEGMDDATAKAVRQMQVATVGVHINRGVMPGVTNFTWNGASGTWRLEFGDNTVQVRAMRPLPSGGKWEATPVAFVPEQVAAEVETAQVLPLDSIKVYVDTNGKFLDNPLVAARVGGSSSRLYRTPLIAIGASSAGVGGQAAVVIPAQPGDKIVFVADQKEGCFYGGAQADVSVYKNPEELSMSWNHALTVCAGLDKKEDILDWSHLPGQQAEALTNYFVFNLSADNCNIQLGQHAGMLMLRDLFIDLMKRQLASLKDTEADDDAVLGFGKSVAQVLKQSPQSLFAGLPVGDLNGQASTMSAAVDDTYIDGVFGKDEHAKRTWRASAFRTALNAYMQSIQGSIDEANGVKDTQFKELLKLTGHGFDAVLAQLNPRLMRRNPDSGQWEPDMIARGYIDSIAFKEKQFEDASEAAKLDTELVVGVVSAVVALPVMLSESAVASFVTWAGNGIIWGVQSADEVYQVYEVKREIGFAAGASVVLGEMRYDEAKTLDTEWWKVAGTIVAQGALANLQGVDALSKYNRELSVVRGLKILEELDGGVSALRKLPKGQLGDIQAAAIKAKALSVAGKELEPGLKQALSTWDAFANELKAGEPALAADLKKAAELKSALLPQDQAAVLTPGAAAAEAGPAAAEAAKLAAARRASVAASIKDLGTETAQLKVAETAAVEGPARKLISGQIKANDARAKIMNDMLEAARLDASVLQKYSDAELAWITGVQKEVSVERMEALLAKNNNAWTDLKYAFEHGNVSASDMHQFVTWRKLKVDKMLDEVIAEVKTEMEGILKTEVELKPNAVGSTDLTSDYDISVDGPGAERVVGRFNDRFRAAHGNLESAFVYDTNVYTNPVYTLFSAREMLAGGLGLGTVEMDTVRQFVYDQMAMRKYVPDEVWAAHKTLLSQSASADTRTMLEFAFKQAEDGNSRAAAIVKAFQGGQTGANAEYQAANKAYAQVLGEIDGWRLEMRRLEGVFIENDAFTARLPDDMLKKFPVYSERIKALQAMVDAKDFKNAEILRTAMEYEVVGQLRDTQGIALYFASEAYQADGTINHVVVELQGASKRTITLDGLLATGKDAKLDSLGYLNSFNENRANMFKELGHLGLFGGKLAAGEKLAAKGSKYFIRQLDAMRRAGCDLNQLVGKDLVEATFKVNAVRGDLDKVKAVLEAAGMTGESFANGVRQASDRLAAAGVQERQFADLAKFLTPDIEDLNRLEGTATATR